MEKVLLIKLRAMGDTVLTTAALEAVKEHLPRAKIHCLLPEMWAPLFESHPACYRIWLWRPARTIHKLLQIFNLVKVLRREKYDLVIALHAAGTSAWIARLTGAKVRSIHFHGIHDKNKFSTVEIPGKGVIKPILERDLDALRALGWAIEKPKVPKVYLSEKDQVAARKWLHERGSKGPLMALGLGASRPTKMWPLEKYVALAQHWRASTQGSVLLVVGPQEAELLKPFFLEPYVMVKISRNVRESAALFAECDLFVGNDSGPKHLAAAVGLRTITLFGPENPLEWHPYEKNTHPVIFREGLSCRKPLAAGLPDWCGLATCEVEQHRCMRDISIDEVIRLWPPQFQNS